LGGSLEGGRMEDYNSVVDVTHRRELEGQKKKKILGSRRGEDPYAYGPDRLGCIAKRGGKIRTPSSDGPIILSQASGKNDPQTPNLTRGWDRKNGGSKGMEINRTANRRPHQSRGKKAKGKCFQSPNVPQDHKRGSPIAASRQPGSPLSRAVGERKEQAPSSSKKRTRSNRSK